MCYTYISWGLFLSFPSSAKGFISVRIRLILRLILALTFATIALIYTELIPPISGTNTFLVRTFFTIIAAGVGFVIFPDLAKNISKITMGVFNFVISRLSSEVSNQMVRIQKQTHLSFPSFGSTSSNVGSVSLLKPLILDTSSIIDGRILDVAKVGFISGLVLIPKMVLLELQQVSDSSDNLKRARGRRGFEIVEELKKIKSLKIEIWDKDQAGKSVDDRLLNLAKSLHGKIITTDFNLNKLASISNVAVLNVNDLSNALKTVSLPGERMKIKIMHIGKDPNQGVGYLADGTMVVISGSADKIGQEIEVEVTKTIQLPAGRMIFGKEI